MSNSDSSRHTGAGLMARELASSGVRRIFCITGAGNLAVVDACRAEGIDFVFSHHEQAAVMEAIGWAQVTGQVGVALVTTGGGAANSLTGVLSGYLDSVPLLVIAGNESSYQISNMKGMRAFGVQGFDSVAVMKPVTKLAVRIDDSSSADSLIRSALEHCLSNRPGPVFVEFPLNLQREFTQVSPEDNSLLDAEMPPSWTSRRLSLEKAEVEQIARDLAAAERPILYFGNGIRSSGAVISAVQLAEELGIPFVLSWSAIDFCSDDHPLNIGRAGIYGDRAVNIALQMCDFLLAVGTRLSIPQLGYDRQDFARNARRWVVDVDQTELSKFDPHSWGLLRADAGEFLESFSSGRQDEFGSPESREDWRATIEDLRASYPRANQIGPGVAEPFLHSYEVIEQISEILDRSAIIVTDVGAGLLTGHYAIRIRNGQRMFTSQGLGEMGFGLPGAIGAQFASPNSKVVCLNTDGGMMFNLQELQVVATHQLPLKLVVFNNQGYTMIRSSQDNLFSGRRIGSDLREELGFPNFSKVADTFSLGHTLLDGNSDWRGALSRALASTDPEIIEVKMSPEQTYLPRLATVKMPDGTLSSPPIEDLTPRLGDGELRGWLDRNPPGSDSRK